jgi:protein-disulfide isomerase
MKESVMVRKRTLVLAAACLIPSIVAANDIPRAVLDDAVQAYLRENPAVIEQAVKDTLARNPQLLQQAIADMLRAKAKPAADERPATRTSASDQQAQIKALASELFSSVHQVSFGPADADVTLVEFFDYNCGFCRKSFEDKFVLMANDPKVRVVLKEFPVLGSKSIEAARVAIAVRMQDNPQSTLYRAFNSRLMAQRGPANQAVAMAAAIASGADGARLERDMTSDEVRVTLEETRRLAQGLGITATPTYVVQNKVVVGAVGLEALRNQIHSTRKP